jgi:hypothetical protein
MPFAVDGGSALVAGRVCVLHACCACTIQACSVQAGGQLPGQACSCSRQGASGAVKALAGRTCPSCSPAR